MGLLGAMKGALGMGGGPAGAAGSLLGKKPAMAAPSLATAQPGGVKPMAMPGGGGGGLAAAAPALGGAVGSLAGKATMSKGAPVSKGRSFRGGRR